MSRVAQVIAAALALALVALMLFLNQCSATRSAKTEADLATGQAGAAMESGHDAVETLGNSIGRESDITNTVEEGTDAIENAPAGDSNDAADRSACRMRSYRHLPKCVALLGPVAE